MDKERKPLGSYDKPGSRSSGPFGRARTCIPVVAEVALQTEMRREVVGESAPDPFGHSWKLKGCRIIGITTRCRNGTTGIEILISHKRIPLGGGVALSERGRRNQDHCNHGGHASYEKAACAWGVIQYHRILHGCAGPRVSCTVRLYGERYSNMGIRRGPASGNCKFYRTAA